MGIKSIGGIRRQIMRGRLVPCSVDRGPPLLHMFADSRQQLEGRQFLH